MRETTSLREELYSLIQMTRSILEQHRSRMILCDEETISSYKRSSSQTPEAHKKNISHHYQKPLIYESFAKHEAAPCKTLALQDVITSTNSIVNPTDEERSGFAKNPYTKERSIQPKQDEEETTSIRRQKEADRLLPRSFDKTAQDTSTIRNAMSKIEGMPHLSACPIYTPVSNPRRTQWVLCTHIAAQESSHKAAFIEAVFQAFRERLSIEIVRLSCEDSTFCQLFPMILADCAGALFFVDHHLEQTLRNMLRTMPLYDPSSHPIIPPFISLGALNKKPLRAVVLTQNGHEDQPFKHQLWAGIKEIVRKTS